MKTVLVPLPPEDWGGLHAFAVNIARDLEAAGWRWLVVVPHEAKAIQQRLRDGGVEVLEASLPRLRRSPLASFKSVASLPAALASLTEHPAARAADVIQAVGAHHPHGLLLARSLGRPLVWQLHSSILPPPLRRVVAPLISGTSDAVLTNGRRVAEAFWRNKAPSPNHFTFYAPIDEKRFQPNPTSRVAAREALGYNDNAFVVGTVGNRLWQKNHELLIRGAAVLADHYPRLRFCIMGAPAPPYATTYHRNVERPAERLNVGRPGYITFLEPRDRVDHWLHALDLFTLTSHAEGVPIALFEAMCAAKPVLSADVGSIAEVVTEGVTGELFRRGDLSAFVEGVRRMMADDQKAATMGLAGQARIKDTFGTARVVDAHLSAYESATSRFQQRVSAQRLNRCQKW